MKLGKKPAGVPDSRGIEAQHVQPMSGAQYTTKKLSTVQDVYFDHPLMQLNG